MNIANFSEATALVRNAIGLAKGIVDAEPESPQRKIVEDALKRAENQLQLAESKAALDLGYHLCKCTFPPQIALEVREGAHKCPKCEREHQNEYIRGWTGGG